MILRKRVGFTFALVLLACGCSEDRSLNDTTADSRGMTGDGGGPAGDAGSVGQCTYNGKVYLTGDVFCATDGCNPCQCNPEGIEGVSCTQRDCSAPAADVPDVCLAQGLAECPRAASGALALVSGEACPTDFTGCILSSTDCGSLVLCACIDEQLSCQPLPVVTNESCSGVGDERACAINPQSPEEQALLCSCRDDKWLCIDEVCPDDKPTQGEACDTHPLKTCHYYYRESQCEHLPLYWHCTCDGTWDCVDDKEDC